VTAALVAGDAAAVRATTAPVREAHPQKGAIGTVKTKTYPCARESAHTKEQNQKHALANSLGEQTIKKLTKHL